MEKRLTLNRADIAELNKLLEQNKEIDSFDLIVCNESGIGYCVDVEYQSMVHDRPAKIRVEVAGVENW